MQVLSLYNSLTRRKESFQPLSPPFVGLYVCGPTVYGEPHLGHARPAVTYDVLVRYLRHLGYRVRYVRNITDVGHLEGDADQGEDKIAKKARLEQLEPMEVAQHYTNLYHQMIDRLGVVRPDIEPRATGHILEQIEYVQTLLEKGFAYVANGSVYFDTQAFRGAYTYGELSGRTDVEEMQAGSRELEGQSEKRHPADFALWKRAEPVHLMRWKSPWGVGFPGWHIECTAMSIKYLGAPFDIHGGGLDLLFPHHEAELAQARGCFHGTELAGQSPARVWLHNNMITVNGQKMGKSLGNFINLSQLYTGQHALLSQGYQPQTIRFFILQSHYRSTLDFSDEALAAAERGLRRLHQAMRRLPELTAAQESSFSVAELLTRMQDALNDDLNTAVALAVVYEAVGRVNSLLERDDYLAEADLRTFREFFATYVHGILGLELPQEDAALQPKLDAAVQIIIEQRQQARARKDFTTADALRDRLAQAGIRLKDGPTGTTWEGE